MKMLQLLDVPHVTVIEAGMLLPESTLSSLWFSVLAAFVAINTVMYVALAFAKILPRLHPGDWLPRNYVRSQTRSIYPDREEHADVPARPVVPWQRGRSATHPD
jgi:hypothetical protein